jgi:ESCRT-I complex subunit VPS28
MSELPPSYESAIQYPNLSIKPPQMTSQYNNNLMSQQKNNSFPLQFNNINNNIPIMSQISQQTIRRSQFNEIKSYDDSTERRRQEELADLYSIIKVTELLEAAYGRDAITSSQYSEACTRLISQYKSTETALIKSNIIQNTEMFMLEYGILDTCPR